ncbi:hypothetical protein MYU51_014545 [Penicillium brevicompactum]
MPNRKSLPTSDLYTVGWIAALSIERAAAISMLDERHDKPSNFNQHESDTNSYSWGQMGDHNVVIASLPAGLYGTTSAATTASGLLASLPQIRVALLVGIGGGIARPESGRDIRLGDVVVSQPEGTTGGVIQYDLGKAGQEWELKGSLSKPPLVLLHALGSLQAEHELGESRVLEFLEVASKLKKGASGYCHQGLENDRLFKPSYAHSGPSDCRGCDTAEKIERAERDTTDPEIHYGTIASGNMLLKDATTRDNILDSIGTECLCFEMEAAGLMNHFPCLVIRGICDYVDSHKNDRWQRYAAATAAAYGKDLLGYVPMKGLQESEKAIDILHSVSREVQSVHVIAKDINQELQDQKSSSHFQAISKWLSASDVSKNFFEALKKRHEGTCTWILQCKIFQEWQSDERRFIWLHGIPGCGKTILSAAVIDHLQRLGSSDIILEFFFDFADNEKQTIDQLLRSLSHQLYSRNPSCRPELDKLFISCENGNQQPASQALAATLLQMLGHSGKVNIIIDALDECKTKKEVLRWMEDIFHSGINSVRLLATSRKEEDIQSELERWLEQKSILSAQEESVNHDIRTFVHSKLLSEPEFERWRTQPGVQDEIEIQIMLKANGMFRWAACQLDTLQKCLDLPMLRRSLLSLPATLEETYARILANIDEVYRDHAVRILQFLTYANRPLSIEEAIDILVVDPSTDPFFDPSHRMPNPRDIMRLCASLVSTVIITRRKRISEHFYGCNETVTVLQLAHLSVQQYLKSERIQSTFTHGTRHIGRLFENYLAELNSRRSIAIICLAYLSYVGDQRTFVELRNDFPFSVFSSNNWRENARACENDDAVRKGTSNLFLRQSQPYRVWVSLANPEDHHRGFSIGAPLYYASLAGSKHSVQLLLDKGVDINYHDHENDAALIVASYHGHQGIVKLLMDHDADIQSICQQRGSALHAASMGGHQTIVQMLLDRGANINSCHQHYGTPLQAAVMEKNYGVVKQLLEAGADINIQSPDGSCIYQNALQAAVSRQHFGIADLLVESEDRLALTAHSISNSLETAVEDNNLRMVQLLLESNCETRIHESVFSSAIYAAASEGSLAVAQLLLTKGADVNARGRGGSSLQQAFLSYRPSGEEIFQLLLDNGASLNTLNDKAPLPIAVQKFKEKTIKRIIDAGFDVNTPHDYYGTPLHAASYRGDYNITRYLLEKGANVNTWSGEYGSALLAAFCRRHDDILRLLLKNGATLNNHEGRESIAIQTALICGQSFTLAALVDKDSKSLGCPPKDCTALLAASSLGLQDIVKLLVDKGADPNGQDSQTDSPLIVSASKGHHGIVQLLLLAGVNVNKKGKNYSNALFAALYNGHHAVVKLLLDEGADVNAELPPVGDDSMTFVGERQVLLKSLKGVRRHSRQDRWDRAVVEKLQYDGFGSALQTAIFKEHKEIANVLLERGANPNVQRGWFGNPLQVAAYKEDISMVQTLLGKGAAVNTPTKYGNTLQIAIFKRNQTLVEVLLQNGADCNSNDCCGGDFKDLALLHRDWDTVRLLKRRDQPRSYDHAFDNALRIASSLGHQGIVQLLIDYGADVNARSSHGETPLKVASYKGHLAVVQLLLDNGADVLSEHGNALEEAISSGQHQIFSLLLEHTPSLATQARRHRSPGLGPLSAASRRGEQDIIQMLLEKGAEVNMHPEDWPLSKPLYFASSEGHYDTVLLLLEKGADVNVQDDEFGYPLEVAAHNGHQDIVKLLLERGANVDLFDAHNPDNEGGPLQLASSQGHHDIAQLLIEQGADVNRRGGWYGSPLHAASSQGERAVVQLLLNKGSDADSWGEFYGTPLQRACINGHHDVVRLLIEKGANVNAKGDDESGQALHAAVCWGHRKIVQLLLDNGADIRSEHCGMSALQIAKNNDHHTIEELLQERGAT